MKELLIQNQEIIHRVYIIVVFLTPWLICMFWHIRYMNSLRQKMGSKFWVTIFPNKEAADIVASSSVITRLQRIRNLWFISTLAIWLLGALFFATLLAWLNDKI